MNTEPDGVGKDAQKSSSYGSGPWEGREGNEIKRKKGKR